MQYCRLKTFLFADVGEKKKEEKVAGKEKEDKHPRELYAAPCGSSKVGKKNKKGKSCLITPLDGKKTVRRERGDAVELLRLPLLATNRKKKYREREREGECLPPLVIAPG